MKIQIGKTYELTPTDKKSVVEVEHWHSEEHGDIDITTVWRWGTWYVTPQNTDEVDLLERALNEDIQLLITGFSDYEMCDLSDECFNDLEYDGDCTEEQFEGFKEEYDEDRWDTLERYGYGQDSTDCYINSQISLKEFSE